MSNSTVAENNWLYHKVKIYANITKSKQRVVAARIDWTMVEYCVIKNGRLYPLTPQPTYISARGQLQIAESECIGLAFFNETGFQTNSSKPNFNPTFIPRWLTSMTYYHKTTEKTHEPDIPRATK